ncbi:translation initiation factor IF-2-like [Harpia harpyja]|uniref:translation initiation factor IF-2-like n=1 Tax=Harpia harpyja TaxID=202280 RepID=UPI0022B1999D|nr:translation initiation factor IF-2-like [Harpia harpyja]
MGQSQGGVTTPDPSGGPPPGGQGPSPLERGLHAVVGTFYQYARAPGGGQEPSLDPPAFQRLLRHELGHQLSDTGQPQAVAAIFALLDANRDRRVSFDRVLALGGLALPRPAAPPLRCHAGPPAPPPSAGTPTLPRPAATATGDPGARTPGSLPAAAAPRPPRSPQTGRTGSTGTAPAPPGGRGARDGRRKRLEQPSDVENVPGK